MSWIFNGSTYLNLPENIVDGEFNRPAVYFKLPNGAWNYTALSALGWTYVPNEELSAEERLNIALAEIEAKYAVKLKALDDMLMNILWTGGEGEASARAALSITRDETLAEMEVEILGLFLE